MLQDLMPGRGRMAGAKTWVYASVLVAGAVLIGFDEGPGMTVDRAMGGVFVLAASALLLRRASSTPRVVTGAWGLRATTPPLATWLSLGGWFSEVVVDTGTRRVHLLRRKGWRSTSRVLKFAEIDRAGYSFRSEGEGLDAFDVSLVLRDGTAEPLFSFKGEVARGEESSAEESLSRTFVRQLQAALGMETTEPVTARRPL